MSARYGYRRFDGSGDDDDLDAEALLDALTDDLLEGGDLSDALNRLLRRGMRTPDGERLEGLRELMERARQRRQELLDRGDPDEQFAEFQDRLDEVEATERSALSALREEAGSSGDERRQEVTEDVVAEHTVELDVLPDRFAPRVEAMRHYEFVSTEAREQFEQLLGELREQLLGSYFEAMRGALAEPDPEQLRRMREGMDALSRMLEQRERGEELDPSFEAFMDQYGDLFGPAETLDELLEQLARRMAAARAMFESLSPEQRAELERLSQSLFEDLDLGFSLNRLAANLSRAFPEFDGTRGYAFEGNRPLALDEATDVTGQLGDLERLEELLSSDNAAAALPEIDLDAVRRDLGEDAARSVERLNQLVRELSDAGLIDRRGGRMELTAHGVRRLGARALRDLFDRLRNGAMGEHTAMKSGVGHDREEVSRPWEPGDTFNLHLPRTVHNAVARSGKGVPVKLSPRDFEIVEHEVLVRSATVLAIDLSMSMPMRDNFVPAKKMAIALATLIRTRFPRDFLSIVVFSEVAREIQIEELPTVMWDYIYGTNLQHALALGRRMLAKEHGTRQILVITDGEPTAHLDDAGEPYFHYPPTTETLRRTMAEVLRCTRAGITINTFALDLERTQFPFVEQIGKVNGGRTFYPSRDDLGSYVLADFLQHRRTLRATG
jgi:uncharacterized protein with von Willebrand factor type A (vWA) domain